MATTLDFPAAVTEQATLSTACLFPMEGLPPVVERALRLLTPSAAHPDTLISYEKDPTKPSTWEELAEWAESNLTLHVLCSGDVRQGDIARDRSGKNCYSPTKGRVKHLVRVDPWTFNTAPVYKKDSEANRANSLHFLWTLATGHQPHCAQVATALALPGTVKTKHSLWGERQQERVWAIRTIGLALQYRNEGLDPFAYGGWISLGATANTVRQVQNDGEDPAVALEAFRSSVLAN